MAKVGQLFQDTFQTNVFQKAWGGIVFQKNVFQNNVFDVPTTIKKIITESLSISETQAKTRELIRLTNESVSIQTFRLRLRALVYHVVESSSIAETQVKKRGIIKLFNESLNNSENILRYRAIIRQLAETSQVSETRVRLRGIKRLVAETVQSLSLIHI